MNVPLLLSGQVYAIDKCDYSRSNLAAFLSPEYPAGSAAGDVSPLADLMSAPFRGDVIFSKFVLCWAALGVLDGIVAYPRRPPSWGDIDGTRMYGRRMERDGGTALYGTSAAALSWGAAVSEEMLFRGILLPALDYRFGKRAGLVTSSAVFGLMHLFNSDIERPVYFIGQATAAGFVFGYHVQNNMYRLDKAIAAHFWYNMVSMATTWLMNPEENPLGFGIEVKF